MGTEPNNTSSPKISAPVKHVLFSKLICTGPTFGVLYLRNIYAVISHVGTKFKVFMVGSRVSFSESLRRMNLKFSRFNNWFYRSVLFSKFNEPIMLHSSKGSR